MKTSFRLALCALVTFAAAASASAQTWPTRPMTVVVPFAAGSSTDTAARILAVGMSEVLGQQLVIENVGGAAGMTGTLRVARAAPDGYQLLFGTVDTLAIAPALQKQPPYDTIKDFTPAGMVVEQPIVLIVREDLRSRPWPNSRPMRKPTRRRCSSVPPASGRARILPALNSMRRSGSIRSMCPIAARPWPRRI
jgi:tripartite-type tricarboxylate transporter receptor subunit TctC